MADTRAVTVRLPNTIYQEAADVSALTGVSFRELVSAGLRREVRARVSEGGDSMRDTLQRMQKFRGTKETSK